MKLTTDKIRNVTVMGHGGVGKTAFVEAALYNAGVIDRMGRSNEGNTDGIRRGGNPPRPVDQHGGRLVRMEET